MVPAQPQPASPEPAPARAFLRGLRAAVVFLTRVPIGGFPYADAEWRWAAGWFPLVGAAVGAVAGAVDSVTSGAGAPVAAALALIATLLLTGAFHEDGLADTADALGGAYDRERLFAILKDSRIGSFGAAALVMSLLLRVLLLARLGPAAPLALVLVGAVSRVSPVWLMAALPYVTGAGARSRPVARGGPPQAVLSTALAAGVVALAHPSLLIAAALAAVSLGVALLCGWRFHVRAGGLTGDFLGATQQVAECALLLALVLAGFGAAS